MARILLIAHEWTPRALLLAQLGEEGHEVTGCLTLDEALLLLRARRPRFDLVIFDTLGQELRERLIARLIEAGPPVILLTGPYDLAGSDLGRFRFSRVLVRPVFVEDVVRAAKEVLETRQ